MTFEVERLPNLWTDPLPDGTAAEDAFREFYTDPVTVNGMSLSAADGDQGKGAAGSFRNGRSWG